MTKTTKVTFTDDEVLATLTRLEDRRWPGAWRAVDLADRLMSDTGKRDILIATPGDAYSDRIRRCVAIPAFDRQLQRLVDEGKIAAVSPADPAWRGLRGKTPCYTSLNMAELAQANLVQERMQRAEVDHAEQRLAAFLLTAEPFNGLGRCGRHVKVDARVLTTLLTMAGAPE
jgi:hypothetical protein